MNRRNSRTTLGYAVACIALMASTATFAADEDALALEGAEASSETSSPALKGTVEAGMAHLGYRGRSGSDFGRRLALDLRYSHRMGNDWRFTASNRLDLVLPRVENQRWVTNSLREAFVTFGGEGSLYVLDFGRIDLRQGPAYGFNPTDYFREGAWRVITSANPIASRGYRLGTVMGRVSRGSNFGVTTLALAPKLANAASPPDSGEFSLDVGATNNSHRALISHGARMGAANIQASVFWRKGHAVQAGLSATAALTDSLVAYGEWSNPESVSLTQAILEPGARQQRFNQAVLGATNTFKSRTSVSVEYEFNERGLRDSDWSRLLIPPAGPAAYGIANTRSQAGQELMQRDAVLLYLTQPDFLMRSVDFTALVRFNLSDGSRFLWGELRYHLEKVDLSLQWQRTIDKRLGQFTAVPYDNIVQAVASWHF